MDKCNFTSSMPGIIRELYHEMNISSCDRQRNALVDKCIKEVAIRPSMLERLHTDADMKNFALRLVLCEYGQ